MAAVFCDSIPIIFLLLHKPVVQFVHRFNSQVMVDVGSELVFRQFLQVRIALIVWYFYQYIPAHEILQRDFL